MEREFERIHVRMKQGKNGREEQTIGWLPIDKGIPLVGDEIEIHRNGNFWYGRVTNIAEHPVASTLIVYVDSNTVYR